MPDLPALHAVVDPEEEPHDPASVPPSGGAECPNCGARLRGRYCHGCGQLDQPLRLPAHRFVSQSLTEFFGLDGRVWTTLGNLLFKPGTLTLAYLRGQRRRYLRPLRVYLSSTLLFFFLLSVLDPVGRLEQAIGDDVAGADSTVAAAVYLAELQAELDAEAAEEAAQAALLDSLRGRVAGLRAAFAADSAAGRFADPEAEADARDALEAAIDDLEDEERDYDRMRGSLDDRRLEWRHALVASYPPDSLVRPADLVLASEIVLPDDGEMSLNLGPLDGLVERGRAYERLKTARTSEARTEAALDLTRTAIGKIPVVLFLMLPVFAILLKVIYVRRGWYYSEHLVFGLHTHAFAFLGFTVVAVLSVVGGPVSEVADVVVLVAIPVYFLIAQKRVYGQGWLKTAAKAVLLGMAYSFVLVSFGTVFAILLAVVD